MPKTWVKTFLELYRNNGYNNIRQNRASLFERYLLQNFIISKDRFSYPNQLHQIFATLHDAGAKPVIVGGFVRDALLGIDKRKDIDIEVYNIDSYKHLAQILSQFGRVNLVGKSFGVCKLRIDDIECDFSLPRKESKVAKGHKGFEISVDTSLTFKEAAKRRDFTINALGYDPLENKLLDEYGGLSDLQNRTLRAVNDETFKEDPLRLLRGVVFAARFHFHFHPSLTKLCKEMIKQNMLLELPKERVFEEFKKLFFKSKKPSRALLLLKHLGEYLYLKELFNLQRQKFKHTLNTLDNLACANEKELALFFAALLLHLPNKMEVMERFTTDKKLILHTLEILNNYNVILMLVENGYREFDLKLAATKMQIEEILRFIKALYPDLYDKIEAVREKSKDLGVLYEALAPDITGKDLLAVGLKPSKDFKKILDELYLLQLQGDEKLEKNFLKKYLKTRGYHS